MSKKSIQGGEQWGRYSLNRFQSVDFKGGEAWKVQYLLIRGIKGAEEEGNETRDVWILKGNHQVLSQKKLSGREGVGETFLRREDDEEKEDSKKKKMGSWKKKRKIGGQRRSASSYGLRRQEV